MNDTTVGTVGTAVIELLAEAIVEVVGRSSRKWVLLLVAFVVGAAAAAVLARRARARAGPSDGLELQGLPPTDGGTA